MRGPLWALTLSGQQLARSPHICQLQPIHTLVGGNATPARTVLDTESDFIILEFAKLGSLDKWLRKAGTLGIRRERFHFPRVMAWRFFDCRKLHLSNEYNNHSFGQWA